MEVLPTRIRLRFEKSGDLRLVSHHDLLRCVDRLLRRAAIPMASTQGFNPRPKISFPLALGLGIEGFREVLELSLAERTETVEVLRRLNEVAPPGLRFFEAERLPSQRPGQVNSVEYRLRVPTERLEPTRAAIAEVMARSHCRTIRSKRDRSVEIDLRPFLLDLSVEPADSTLRLRLKVEPSGSARPEEVLSLLGLDDLLGGGVVLGRTDVHLTAVS